MLLESGAEVVSFDRESKRPSGLALLEPVMQVEVVTLFEQALEIPSPLEREAFLEQQCAQNAALRGQVQGLLVAYTSAGDFLEAPAADLQGIWGEVPDTFHTSDTKTPNGNAPCWRLDFLAPPRESGHLGRLAHYEIWEVIGSGGMGLVMKAQDEKLQRLVAVKALAPAWAASDAARKRFVREAQSAAAVSHDHLVPIYAVEDSGPVPYFVMQYIAGGSLDYIDDRQARLACTPGWEAANYRAVPPDVIKELDMLQCPMTLIVGGRRSTCPEPVIEHCLPRDPIFALSVCRARVTSCRWNARRWCERRSDQRSAISDQQRRLVG